MVPHSRCHCIRQSAIILGDCCMRQRREWGTIAAAIGHLGHDGLADIVDWLWVVIYVGMRKLLYQAIGDTLPMRWRWASSSALELSVRQPPHQIGHCVLSSGQQHHWGMMRGGGSGKIEGIRAGRDNSYNRWVCTSISHGGHHCPMATMGPHWGPLPAFKHTTISKHTMRQDYVVKTRKKNH